MTTDLNPVASAPPFAPRSRGGVALRLTAVDELGLEARAKTFATRSIKTRSKLASLHLAVSCIDLTTLEGMDTPGKVAALCQKAIRPDAADPTIPSVAAVCVYPQLVAEAVRHTASTSVGVASVAGAFPRSESGRTFPVALPDGSLIANVSKASRKDLRDAVRSARSAQTGWAGRTAYNRGQILYRVAEVMEGRRSQLAEELRNCGVDARAARREVGRAIDRWVWYAGWCDKFHQVAGTVNPVAGPYFNFTMPDPSGVVGIVAPDAPSLLGLTSRLAPALVSGNTAVVVAGETSPLASIAMAEVFATSDVPGGVVNILTGSSLELLPWMLGHRDIDAVDLTGAPPDLDTSIVAEAADNLKRLVRGEADEQSPYVIADFCEMKSVWHPVGR